jgi:hypothetical protein
MLAGEIERASRGISCFSKPAGAAVGIAQMGKHWRVPRHQPFASAKSQARSNNAMASATRPERVNAWPSIPAMTSSVSRASAL